MKSKLACTLVIMALGLLGIPAHATDLILQWKPLTTIPGLTYRVRWGEVRDQLVHTNWFGTNTCGVISNMSGQVYISLKAIESVFGLAPPVSINQTIISSSGDANGTTWTIRHFLADTAPISVGDMVTVANSTKGFLNGPFVVSFVTRTTVGFTTTVNPTGAGDGTFAGFTEATLQARQVLDYVEYDPPFQIAYVYWIWKVEKTPCGEALWIPLTDTPLHVDSSTTSRGPWASLLVVGDSQVWRDWHDLPKYKVGIRPSASPAALFFRSWQ